MKKIISEISANAMSGPLKQILDNVSGADGQYWLAQLNRFLLMKPTHALADEMLQELHDPKTWQNAKTNMERGKGLWWKKPEWPFEIATFVCGNLSREVLKEKVYKKLKESTGNQGDFDINAMMRMIDDPSVKFGRKRNVQLVKIKSRFLLTDQRIDHSIDDLNVNYPKYNLRRCNEEIGCYLYLKNGPLDEATISMSSSSLFKGKHLISWYVVPTGKKYVRLNMLDISIFNKISKVSEPWVFQFE